MDKLQNVDWRGLYKTATNKVKKYAMNLSELELQVEDATNLEVWGPHGSVMNEIAEACYDPESYKQVMGVLSRRLKEEGERWRMCYKALLLLEFLIKHGPMRVVRDLETSGGALERLTRFEYKDANGRDHGQNVRHRAKEIVTLLADPAELQAEREKAKANRAKYTGVSAADMRHGSSGFGARAAGSSAGRFSRGAGASAERPNIVSNVTSSVSNWVPGLEPSGGRHATLAGGSFSESADLDTTRIARHSPDWADPHHDGSHVISKRAGGGVGGIGAGGGALAGEDALAATQARIEALRVNDARAEPQAVPKPFETASSSVPTEQRKKLLTDVKVNPKIAASLGLKVSAPARSATAAGPQGHDASAASVAVGPAATPASPPAAAAADFDLLDVGFGSAGLESTAPPPTSIAVSSSQTVAAAQEVFDPFAAMATGDAGVVSVTASKSDDAWDAFATGPESGPTNGPADGLWGLDGGAGGSVNTDCAAAGRAPLPADLFSVAPVPPPLTMPGIGAGVSGAPGKQSPGLAAPDAFGSMLSAGGYGTTTTSPGAHKAGPDPFADLLK